MKHSSLYCIDIGNTTTELAIVENKKIYYKEHISTQDIKDDFKTLKLLFKEEHLKNIKEDASNVIVSSVVPEVNNVLKLFLEKIGFSKVLFIKDLNLPLKGNFSKTGADIIAKAFYLEVVKEENALILDVGTATVMQYVNSKAIEKVAITLGLGTIYLSLHARTSLLPLINPERIENILQDNTVASMQSGTYWGYVGLLNMFVKKAKQELYPKKPKVFLTGGLSKLLLNDLEFEFKHDPDIIFKSLDFVYNTVVKGC